MKLLAVNKVQRYSLKVQLLHIVLRTDMLKMTAQFGSLNLINVNFVYVQKCIEGLKANKQGLKPQNSPQGG